METPSPNETNVVSFVMRFVYDKPNEWHGVIRHIQSDAEMHFTHWDDARKFVAQYVEVGSVTIKVNRETKETGK